MTLVRNRLTLPGGTPLYRRALVEVRLRPGPGFAGSPVELEVAGVRRLLPDSTGYWEIDLTPNAAISPAGTEYELRQVVGDEQSIWPFVVPPAFVVTASSRTSNVVTVTLSTPATGLEEDDECTVDLADATYDGTFFINAPAGSTVTWTQFAANDASGGVGTLTKAWDVGDLVV